MATYIPEERPSFWVVHGTADSEDFDVQVGLVLDEDRHWVLLAIYDVCSLSETGRTDVDEERVDVRWKTFVSGNDAWTVTSPPLTLSELNSSLAFKLSTITSAATKPPSINGLSPYYREKRTSKDRGEEGEPCDNV